MAEWLEWRGDPEYDVRGPRRCAWAKYHGSARTVMAATQQAPCVRTVSGKSQTALNCPDVSRVSVDLMPGDLKRIQITAFLLNKNPSQAGTCTVMEHSAKKSMLWTKHQQVKIRWSRVGHCQRTTTAVAFRNDKYKSLFCNAKQNGIYTMYNKPSPLVQSKKVITTKNDTSS